MKELNNFEEYLKYELNYSDYTIKEYLLYVKDYLKYLEKNKKRKYKKIFTICK